MPTLCPPYTTGPMYSSEILTALVKSLKPLYLCPDIKHSNLPLHVPDFHQMEAGDLVSCVIIVLCLLLTLLMSGLLRYGPTPAPAPATTPAPAPGSAQRWKKLTK